MLVINKVVAHKGLRKYDFGKRCRRISTEI